MEDKDKTILTGVFSYSPSDPAVFLACWFAKAPNHPTEDCETCLMMCSFSWVHGLVTPKLAGFIVKVSNRQPSRRLQNQIFERSNSDDFEESGGRGAEREDHREPFEGIDFHTLLKDPLGLRLFRR